LGLVRYATISTSAQRTLTITSHGSGRKRVFAAAATIPCDKNDLAEALAERVLRDASPEVVERAKEEPKNAGQDIDRPKIGEKFIDWIRAHC
jgi:hypothetical protein